MWQSERSQFIKLQNHGDELFVVLNVRLWETRGRAIKRLVCGFSTD